MYEQSFNELELKIIDFWRDQKIFEKSLENRVGAPSFIFNDGPPFATGLPHYGHLLASTIKDSILRFKTMQGFHVPRRFGWDCHGLPVESEIEKIHQLSGNLSIEHFGIERFNEECRSIVMRYSNEWKKTVERIGRWVDFSDNWHTMDLKFMESVWWTFNQLNKKGLVYEGFKVMPISTKLGTPLSNFEATSNYKMVDDPSVILKFFLEGKEKECFLVWTTTPWTLPSNVALAVGEKIEYTKVLFEGTYYILAKERIEAIFGKKEREVVEHLMGADLVGLRFEPLFNQFIEKKKEGAWQVISADFVSTAEGTGIVHIAPSHGEDDFYAVKEARLPMIICVDDNGCFNEAFPLFKGDFVKDVDKKIIQNLKERGLLFDQKRISHRYPFCWRTDTPLIYKAVNTWFVAVEKIKADLLENNKEIHWMPEHIKEGRFGKWLENARDWAISRFRYWGTPLPIWRSADGECIFIGSIQELEKLTGKKITDLHRHFIDQLLINKEGKVFRRIPDVFDCWFESGSMPWAQNNYPICGNDSSIPADFIAEGIDQTRGWFYTLTILSTALFNKPPFKNVIVNGILLAEDGNKMSKRLKNYPEPSFVIKECGADAVRLYMLSSPAAYGDDLRFSKKGVESTLRSFLIPLINALHFYKTYASIYSFTPKKEEERVVIKMDKWIYSLVQKLGEEVANALDRYDLPKAVKPLTHFIEQLTNWYIRRSRSRFWAEEETADRNSAFSTLYRVLFQLAKIAAPFTPFIAEHIFRTLRTDEDYESVHLCDFPKIDLRKRAQALEEEMELVQNVVSLGHALRKEIKIKVRQPLMSAYLVIKDVTLQKKIEKHTALIKDELNVKKIEFEIEESRFVRLTVQPNFRVLGKKVGRLMPKVKKTLENLSVDSLHQFEKTEHLILSIEGEEVMLSSEDILIRREVIEGVSAKTDGTMSVALDTHMTTPLLMEGVAREVVNRLNSMRRDQGFFVQDRICVKLDASDFIITAFEKHRAYIEKETLIKEISFEENEGEQLDLNGEEAHITISKVLQ